MKPDDPRLGQAEEYHRTVEDEGERPLCELYRCDHIHALVKAARALVTQAKFCGEFMLDEGYKRGNDLLEDAEAAFDALKPFE